MKVILKCLPWRSGFRAVASVKGLCALPYLLAFLPALLTQQAFAQSPASVTTLALTQNGSPVTTVAASSVITLTASVTSAGAPVTRGTVNFCFQGQTSCVGAALLATAQLTPSGTAAVQYHPAAGSHNFIAVFVASSTVQGSTSAPTPLSVTPGALQSGILPTTTTLSYMGSPGSYNLTAQVGANNTGSAPTGKVSFVDITNNNTVLGTVTLGAPATGAGFLTIPASTTFQGAAPMAVGDFNHDGNPDLIASLNGAVTLQTGMGDNTFSTGVTIPGNPGLVTVGDFNSDGNLDLATIVNNSLQIQFGDGAGNFTPASTSTSLPTSPGGMYAADFNRDGNLDLVLVDYTNVYIYLGAGDGTFTAGYTYQVVPIDQGSITSAQNGLATGDFNGDGIVDFAVGWQIVGASVGGDSSFNVLFFFGDGAGNFTPSYVQLPANFDPELFGGDGLYGAPPGNLIITASDYNNDGKADIGVDIFYFACCPGASESGSFEVLSNGDGTFNIPTPFNSLTLGPPVASTAVDTSGDGTGYNSVIYAMGETGPLEGLQGDAPSVGYAGYSILLPPNYLGEGLIAGDYNSDGIQEIALGGPINESIIGLQAAASGSISAVDVMPYGSGAHQIEAIYAGDATHTTSTSAAITIDAQQITPKVVLTAPSAVISGQVFTLTATVATTSGPQPTGIVSFYNNAGYYDSAALTNGATSVTLTAPGPGTYTYTAYYQGDNNYAVATSSPINVTVTLPAPNFVLTTPTPSITYGSPITLTAAVPAASSGVSFTKKVSVYNGTTLLGSAAFDKSNTATLAIPAAGLPAGSDSLTAVYPGDNSYPTFSSNPLSVTVAKATSNLVVTTSTASPTYDSPTSFTATLTTTAPIPVGSITFKNGATILGSAPIAPVDRTGVATLPIPAPGLPAGLASITATYAGDSNYAAVTSPSLNVTVGKATPSLVLIPSASTITAGATATLTVALPAADPSPSGTVTFLRGTATLASVPVTGSTVKLVTTTLPAGFDSLTASWTGDSYFSAATTPAVILAVAPPITLAAATSTIYAGVSDTITITLATPGSTTVPTGTVTLISGSWQSSATTLAAGTATITIPANTLPAGTDIVSALYSGDTIYPATSTTLTLTVSTAPAPTFTLSSPTISVTAGASTNNTVQIALTPVTGFTGTVDLTAQITASPAGATDPPTVTLNPSSVALNGSGTASSTLTITTTAKVVSSLNQPAQPPANQFGNRPGTPGPGHEISPGGPLLASGGALLASILLWGIPARRRKGWLSAARNLAIAILLAGAATATLSGCGGSTHTPVVTNPGTTAGTYTITITGKSGTITTTSTVTLTVQ